MLPPMGAAERTRIVDDSTPLNGDVIDVGARIAWSVRMARLTVEPGLDNRLRTMAAAIGSSPAHLSRVETGQRRDGRVIDGYEQALGMPQGSLRAPIEVLCRTFPRWSPRDLDPGPVIREVAELSALTGRIQSGEPVPAGQWLVWASAMAQPGNIGLPADQMTAILTRLIGELARTQGHAYPIRYEALARLRCSPYGQLVLEAVREHSTRPYPAGLYDLMSAVSEAHSPDAVEWFLSLLEGEDDSLVVAGALSLENLGEVTGPSFWASVAQRIVAVFDNSAEGSCSAEWSAHLLRLIPHSVRPEVDVRPSRPVPPPLALPAGARGPDNEVWVSCTQAAGKLTADLGLSEQPMLARLFYDIAFGHWETRAVTSYMLLDALPRISGSLGPAFASLLDTAAAAGARDRLVRRVSYSLFSHDMSLLNDWVHSPDDTLRSAALVAAGPARVHLPSELLLDHASRPGFVRAVLYSAGMSEHPVLDDLAGHPTLDPRVREGAAWWRAAGGVLRD